jgi:CRISPR-associated protein Csx3
MKILEVVLTSEVLTPEQLPELLRRAKAALPPGGIEGLTISGRMPVWAYAALVHLYHPRPFIATFDPRLGGAVVVESHEINVRIGEVLPLSGETVKVNFP